MILDEDLLEDVGSKTAPPPPPEGGIKKQWFPAILRWPIRWLITPFLYLDISAQWIAKQIIRPPFKKVGTCKKRGNCCYYILIRKSKGLGFIDLFWHTQINGFYRRKKEPINAYGKKFYLMGCRYLRKDGTCAHYKTRPLICRTWPRIEYFGYPQILKGCGFKAQPRGNSPFNIIE